MCNHEYIYDVQPPLMNLQAGDEHVQAAVLSGI